MATSADHIAHLRQAVTRLDLTPDQLRWHYVQLALATNDGNVSTTARKLGMHRRTLQRMLGKNPPQRPEVAHG